MTRFFLSDAISDSSRRAFVLRGGAFMATAAVSSGGISAPARAAPFPVLFNSRQQRVIPDLAVAANMAALEAPPSRCLETGGAGLLHAVQGYVNACRYRPETRSEDFAAPWRLPGAFLREGGDCRDFAVAKYLLLRCFGLAHHDLRLVLLDLSLPRRPRPQRRTQTVLAVNLGGKVGILDNFHGHVLPHERMLECRPLWSLNRHGLWRHLGYGRG